MATMRVTVLGATGEMGARVTHLLESRGHEVVRASRATGVDAATGAGLDDDVRGVDALVDCLNITTMSGRTARAFFCAAAKHAIDAANRHSVPHVVLVSIVNVTRPAVRSAVGYYGGKARQEETYASSGLPLTVVATTAWFTLAQQFLDQVRIGRLALVPSPVLQPVHPDAVATAISEAVDRGPGVGRVELAGPDLIPAGVMARRLANSQGGAVRVVRLPVPRGEVRDRGFLPAQGATIDPRRFDDWVADQARVSRRSDG